MARPVSSRDEMIFGRQRSRPHLPRLRSTHVLMAIALAAAAAASAGAVFIAVSRPRAVIAARPLPGITVVNGNELAMQVRGAGSSDLWVRYLRVGRGLGTIWLDVVVTGLRGGFDYTATAGNCVQGRPRALASVSGTPYPRGLLVLGLDNLPVISQATGAWVRLSTVYGAQLGGIRGSFDFMGPVTFQLGPHTSTC